jgi:hypothetical protein
MSIPKNPVFTKDLPLQNRRSKYSSLLEACRKNPSMWTIFNDNAASGLATHLKSRHPDFEFVSRANKTDGIRSTVYGRFVGEVDLELTALLDNH